MRYTATFAISIVLAASALPLWAGGPDSKPFDMDTIHALELRASQAQPRDQCFLYAELVHQMTEVSMKQYAAGDVDNATSLLKRVQLMAQKIHLSMGVDDKRLKNAEILLSHTAFRLNELLHSTSYEDRPLVEAALTDVNQAQNEAMMQVFKK